VKSSLAVHEPLDAILERYCAPVHSVRIGSSWSMPINEVRVELDSHADTCIVGRNCLVVNDHCRPVNVYGFDPSDGSKSARIVDAAIKYISPFTGEKFILMINQAIEIKGLDHHLLCPMQCRLNGARINELPKFLADLPTLETHAIQLSDPDDPTHPLLIPLKVHGVTSYFTAMKPTPEEYEDQNITHIELTGDSPPWDPSDPDFARREDTMVDLEGKIVIPKTSARGRFVISSVQSYSHDGAVDLVDDENFAVALEENVNVRISKVSSTPSVALDHETLAKRWNISPDKAKMTIRKTTQRGMRTVLHPTLSRRFRTNDRMLRYRRIPYDMYSDTMFSNTVSRRMNKMAQVYATDFGWSRVFPMKTKGEAHETLSLLFQ